MRLSISIRTPEPAGNKPVSKRDTFSCSPSQCQEYVHSIMQSLFQNHKFEWRHPTDQRGSAYSHFRPTVAGVEREVEKMFPDNKTVREGGPEGFFGNSSTQKHLHYHLLYITLPTCIYKQILTRILKELLCRYPLKISF